ncbi:glycosyltransferase family 8 protein [Candidatus Saccharibacteria bacterium]|nr:glycosyltransferase family 8 protein [Candidatus Saccharibacteria bacterium]
MNILFCGDRNIVDGVTIAILSLIKNVNEPLNIYIFTMEYANSKKRYYPILEKDVAKLSKKLKEKDSLSTLRIIDVGEEFKKEPVTANMRTYFTPYCMLRLYADKLPDFPEKFLYLDTDVVCLKDPSALYNINMEKYEMAGALDRYGSHIYRLPFHKKRYINSGVLLLNLKKIRETGLFERARRACKKYPMIMPDQSALNFCSKYKKIVSEEFNNQKEITRNTVFRHFSNTFKFFPFFKVIRIKPWDEKLLHENLNCFKLDDILAEWKALKEVK